MQSSLLGQRWVHRFEEDTATGAVYRPDDDSTPLSRRPREVLEFEADGTARFIVTDAADRPAARQARWHEERGAVIVDVPGGKGREAQRLTIHVLSKDRIVVDR
jgi:hypothetical protein